MGALQRPRRARVPAARRPPGRSRFCALPRGRRGLRLVAPAPLGGRGDSEGNGARHRAHHPRRRGAPPPVDHQLQLLEERRFSERTSVFAQALGGIGVTWRRPRSCPWLNLSLPVQSRREPRAPRRRRKSGRHAGCAERVPRAERYLSLGLELAAGDDRALASRILMTAPLRGHPPRRLLRYARAATPGDAPRRARRAHPDRCAALAPGLQRVRSAPRAPSTAAEPQRDVRHADLHDG